jgi:FRG domain
MSQGIIDELRFDSAEDFLAALSPAHARWHPDPMTWLFRGHADSSWKLFAKAYRIGQQPYAPFGVDCRLEEGDQEWSIYSDAEEELLDRFSRGLDRAGLPIPARAVEVRRAGAERIYGAETHPDAIPLLALAQHFGLPTKLLDWSRQSRIAAYFASADAARTPQPNVDLAVWALRSDFVKSISERPIDATTLTIRTAPASSNPNLHAQQGLFTRTEGENGHRHPVDDFVKLAAVAAQSWKLTPWYREQGLDPNAIPRPLMRCLRLPQRDAPQLLRLLAYEGVTGATTFPGYEGVVRAMKEEALWNPRRRTP